MAEPPLPRTSITALSIFLSALKLAVVLAVLFLLWRYWDNAAFEEWKKTAGPVPFFAALAILPLAGVPATPFYLVAGATFGISIGLIGSFLAIAVNLSLSYWIARKPLHTLLVRFLAKTNREIPSIEIFGSWRVTLLVKFAPGIPGFLKSYLIALAGVPLRIYFPTCFLISAFYATAFIVLGDSALDRDPAAILITAGILALVTAIVWCSWRGKGV